MLISRGPALLPPSPASLAGGVDERIALGLAVQVGEPGLTDGVNDGVEHRGLLGNVTGVISRVRLRPGDAHREIAQDPGPRVLRFARLVLRGGTTVTVKRFGRGDRDG